MNDIFKEYLILKVGTDTKSIFIAPLKNIDLFFAAIIIRIAMKLKISANMIDFLSIILLGALIFSSFLMERIIIILLLYIIFIKIWDYSDGTIARYNSKSSLKGHIVDETSDSIREDLIFVYFFSYYTYLNIDPVWIIVLILFIFLRLTRLKSFFARILLENISQLNYLESNKMFTKDIQSIKKINIYLEFIKNYLKIFINNYYLIIPTTIFLYNQVGINIYKEILLFYLVITGINFMNNLFWFKAGGYLNKIKYKEN